MRALHAATAVAATAMACVAAAPSGPIFLPTHAYGLGERQAYVIARDTRLLLRFARADGTIGSTTIAGSDERSVAFTVEGFSDNGRPVLGVATEGAANGRPSSAEPLETSSPTVEDDGSVHGESFSAFAPAVVVLNGIESQAMDIGTAWHGHGDLNLPFARADVRLDGKVNFKSGEAQATLLQALLRGSASISGRPKVAPYGALKLTGGGIASGNAYFSPSRHLLLGMDLTVSGSGNATDARGRRGSYSLVAHWSIKLARYASGTVPGPGLSPGIGIPATEMGGAAPAATNVYSQGSPADVFHPASISPDVIDSTNASAPPTAAPSPDESLPPIPVEMPSDQPIASPPPGPTPTSS